MESNRRMHRKSKKVEVPKFVLPLPFPFSLIYRGTAFYDFVLLGGSILKDLKSTNPKPESVGVLLHELEHYKRMRKLPRWSFAWKYMTNKQFRFEEEMAADRTQLAYLKEAGFKYDFKKRARRLSGIIYRWCVNYDTALERLEKLWGEV